MRVVCIGSLAGALLFAVPAPAQERVVPARTASAGAPETGIATVYSDDMHGQPTASGAPYDRAGLTAAHRSLPLGTRLRVHNLTSGQQVEVRVNDRWGGGGGRVVNLSARAADLAGFGRSGTADVRLEVIELGDDRRIAPPEGSAPVGPPAPLLPARIAAEHKAPNTSLAQCQNEAAILGLADEFYARHVRLCTQRRARGAP